MTQARTSKARTEALTSAMAKTTCLAGRHSDANFTLKMNVRIDMDDAQLYRPPLARAFNQPLQPFTVPLHKQYGEGIYTANPDGSNVSQVTFTMDFSSIFHGADWGTHPIP